MPCPQGIDVPRIFELYNDAMIYRDIKTAQSIYHAEQHAADCCNECGACVNGCPKKIAIPEWLKTAHQLISGYE
jgi:predicted aldo/keto reductase-like oxidoreductase